MLRAIVFDFDGVIVDSEPLHYRAFLRIADPFGVRFDYDQYLARYVGYDDRDGFRVMLTDAGHPDLANDPDRITTLCQQKAAAFESVVAEGVTPIPGALELIDHLHPHLPLAIASGATRSDIDLILTRLGRADLFNPIVTADDVTRSKPHPQTYTLAVAGLNDRLAHRRATGDLPASTTNDASGATACSPSSVRPYIPDTPTPPHSPLLPPQCLAIEDTPAGIQSARDAGLQTLALTTTCPAHLLNLAHRTTNTLNNLTLNQLNQWFDPT